jgi:phytol kinase
MNNQIGITLVFLVTFLLLLIFNEMVYRRLHPMGEITRKLAHFLATLSTVTFPFLFDNHWYVFALAVIFFLLLFFSRKRRYLKSIHDIDRKSLGSYLLPVAIYLTFLFSHLLDNKFMFILPILVLAICDPVAGILGMNLQVYNHQIRIFKWKLNKTSTGSISFFIACFIISLIALYFYRMSLDFKTFGLSMIIAMAGTLTEMFSWKGTDNLFIPMVVLLILVLFL